MKKRKKTSNALQSNGLSIVVFGLFLIFLLGQSLTGWRAHNEDLREHGQAELSYGDYATGGEFLESVFENWESEFLQMGLFILLTVFLYQRGSSESNPLPDEGDEPSKPVPPGQMPWAARYGGLVRTLYEHSLSLAMGILFLASFLLHGISGRAAYNEEQALHGGEGVGLLQYLGTSRFWFESFQNWQSEFLAIGAIVVLSIFLREKDSSQSKEVASPHHRTAG